MENKQPIPRGQTFDDALEKECLHEDECNDEVGCVCGRTLAVINLRRAHGADKQEAVRAALEGLRSPAASEDYAQYGAWVDYQLHQALAALDQPTGGSND